MKCLEQDGFKAPSLNIVIPITNDSMSTKANGNINNRSHQTELSNGMLFKKLPPKSLRKMNSDAIIVEKEKFFSTRILRSSSKCGVPSHRASKVIFEDNLAKTALSATMTADTGSMKVSSTEQTKNILALNSMDNKQTTTKCINILPKFTAKSVTMENSGINLHPRRCKLKTGCNSSNVTAVDTTSSQTTNVPISFTNNYKMFLDIRKQVIKLCI